MKLEDYVLSLYLAKDISKYIEQYTKSLFVWEFFDEKCHGVKFIPYAVVTDKNGLNNASLFPAYTGDELLEVLPHHIASKKHEAPFDNFRLAIKKILIYSEENKYFYLAYSINYLCETFDSSMLNQMENNPFIGNLFDHNIFDRKFSDALAKTLFKLVDDKYI